ncbi:DUF6193 family natural product biosynthesis protein [Streptomyces iakyrus]|uniref:DUF6193 family natural product biosynthesis protein n=1 Tax=Streptomyces iakyrus TaxID=68219 RepID=UPI003810E142
MLDDRQIHAVRFVPVAIVMADDTAALERNISHVRRVRGERSRRATGVWPLSIERRRPPPRRFPKICARARLSPTQASVLAEQSEPVVREPSERRRWGLCLRLLPMLRHPGAGFWNAGLARAERCLPPCLPPAGAAYAEPRLRGLYPFPTQGALHFLRSAPPWLDLSARRRTGVAGAVLRATRRHIDAGLGAECRCAYPQRGNSRCRSRGRSRPDAGGVGAADATAALSRSTDGWRSFTVREKRCCSTATCRPQP